MQGAGTNATTRAKRLNHMTFYYSFLNVLDASDASAVSNSSGLRSSMLVVAFVCLSRVFHSIPLLQWLTLQGVLQAMSMSSYALHLVPPSCNTIFFFGRLSACSDPPMNHSTFDSKKGNSTTHIIQRQNKHSTCALFLCTDMHSITWFMTWMMKKTLPQDSECHFEDPS